MRSNCLLVRLPAALSAQRGPLAALALAAMLIAPTPVVAAPRPLTAEPAARATGDAGLPPPPGSTTLVSQRRGGGFANGASSEPSISANGRYVAFTSAATNLVGTLAFTPPSPAVYVRDRQSGSTIIVPLPSGMAGGSAGQPSISANGRVVAFTYQPPTTATLVVIGGPVVMAWDRQTGQTQIVSRTAGGSAATNSGSPSVSSTGRYVAYTSQSAAISRLDIGTNPDVFRYDRQTGQTVLVSVGLKGVSPDASSIAPSISSGGNLVAFTSDGGGQLVTANPGSGDQVYVRNISAGSTEWISAPPDGSPANGTADNPSISADGRYVAFEATSSNLVAGDTNRLSDVFRRDRSTGTTVMVSVTPDGAPANGSSGQASISADGQMVAFASAATDLVAGLAAFTGNRLAAVALRTSEVYERDLVTGDTVMASVTPQGDPGGGRSLIPVIGGNGRYVAFASTAATLVPGDPGPTADVFLRDFPPGPRLNPPVLDLGQQPLHAPGPPAAAVLTNTGFGPLHVSGASIAGTDQASFSVVADACSGRTLRRGEACTVSVLLTPARAGTLSASLRVPDDAPGSPRTARLRGVGSPVATGRIVLDPTLGPPGIVTVVSGSGFPPGAPIALRWSEGITPTLPPVAADATGRFQVQVLVLHGDLTGPRTLIAEPVSGTLFAPAKAPMLVTPASVGPPGFGLIRLIDVPLMLLFRG